MQERQRRANIFPLRSLRPDLNFDYIRNSAKVVIDAYNGTVDIYLIDPVDPIKPSRPCRRICKNTVPDRGADSLEQRDLPTNIVIVMEPDRFSGDRGNLLVIPIENSILYTTPLYLRAELRQLPELKRVI